MKWFLRVHWDTGWCAQHVYKLPERKHWQWNSKPLAGSQKDFSTSTNYRGFSWRTVSQRVDRPAASYWENSEENQEILILAEGAIWIPMWGREVWRAIQVKIFIGGIKFESIVRPIENWWYYFIKDAYFSHFDISNRATSFFFF